MNEDQIESLIVRFGCIADNLGRIATAIERRLIIDHPPKREVRDATITHIATEEEQILQDQGYEKGELGRWLDIGRRERAFEENAGSTGIQGSPARSRTDKTRS